MAAKRVLVLGMGMQGKAALHDLVSRREVGELVVADSHPDIRQWLANYPADRITFHSLDAGDEARVRYCMSEVDLVVDALPGPFALRVAELAAEAGVHLISSMFYDDPGQGQPQEKPNRRERITRLDQKARDAGVTILTEFGLDPGLDLVMSAQALSELDEVHEYHSYGAGIPDPQVADNPLRYKFSWSVQGVMDAYRRQGQIITGGRLAEIPAGKIFDEENTHLLDIPEVGPALECYVNGEVQHYAELFGLTGSVKEMGRYTCRLPGHCAIWRILAQSGFLDSKPVAVNGHRVAPNRFLAALLGSQSQFHYAPGEKDLALVRIDARGLSDGRRKRVVYQLIDRRDLVTGFSAMQRTVGFTLSLGARLILSGDLARRGLISPIEVPYETVVAGLAPHGIEFSRQETGWE